VCREHYCSSACKIAHRSAAYKQDDFQNHHVRSPTVEQQFRELIASLTTQLAGRPLDRELDTWLNENHGAGSKMFDAIKQACIDGVEAGWMCAREADGIKYGRVLKAADDLHRFSVDVVDMNSLAGPRHAHPNGEIDMVMPLDGDARFDNRPAGWCVYRPGTVHRPTVTGGRALVLYLLPEGKIDFNVPEAAAHA
jgi:hypothetical protein